MQLVQELMETAGSNTPVNTEQWSVCLFVSEQVSRRAANHLPEQEVHNSGNSPRTTRRLRHYFPPPENSIQRRLSGSRGRKAGQELTYYRIESKLSVLNTCDGAIEAF